MAYSGLCQPRWLPVWWVALSQVAWKHARVCGHGTVGCCRCRPPAATSRRTCCHSLRAHSRLLTLAGYDLGLIVSSGAVLMWLQACPHAWHPALLAECTAAGWPGAVSKISCTRSLAQGGALLNIRDAFDIGDWTAELIVGAAKFGAFLGTFLVRTAHPSRLGTCAAACSHSTAAAAPPADAHSSMRMVTARPAPTPSSAPIPAAPPRRAVRSCSTTGAARPLPSTRPSSSQGPSSWRPQTGWRESRCAQSPRRTCAPLRQPDGPPASCRTEHRPAGQRGTVIVLCNPLRAHAAARPRRPCCGQALPPICRGQTSPPMP